MCGVFGVINHAEAARLTYLGLYALQHRGEESAGIVSYDGARIHYHKGPGLACDVFDEKAVDTLKGRLAIGHVRYSTTGASNEKNIQPFFANHRKGKLAVAHNGNFTNTSKLHQELEESGSIFQTTMDSEIIIHLIAKANGKNLQDSITHAFSRIEGAYSVAMVYNDCLIGARDPQGFRPLCIGKVDGAHVIASETCALDLIGAEYIRDVEPGEIVLCRDGKIESLKPFKNGKRAFCVFEHVYFSRPDSNIFTKNVYLTRIRLGRQLAKENPCDGDIVMPIPDSGNYAAIGYAEESKIPFGMGIVRNHYIGRTFIQPTQFIRDFKVKVKLNPIRDVLEGKRIIVIEDSIVRGTTSKARVKALREAGAREVHMRVTCPPIKSPCFYGIDFPTKKELIANKRNVEDIRKYMELDSLEYLSLEGMLEAMLLPKDQFCTACFSGKYPTVIEEKVSKHALEKGRS